MDFGLAELVSCGSSTIYGDCFEIASIPIGNTLKHYLNIETSSVGGTTDLTPGTYRYIEGSQISVDAIPEPRYVFACWELDGIEVGNEKYDEAKEIQENVLGK